MRTGIRRHANASWLTTAGLLVSLFLCGAAYSQVSAWRPDRNIEIVVGASPGGSGDRTARLLQNILTGQKLINVSTTILNKAGGGGTISRVYLNQHAGDAHYISIAPLNLLTNEISGVTSLSFRDLTPLGHLYDEYIGFAVRADSPFKSGRGLAEQLRKSPDGISVGIATTAGNPNHIAVALVAKAAGGDPRKLKTVVFSSAGQAATALLGGHIDLVPASVAALLPHLAAGTVRLIGVTSPQRLHGSMAATPTWQEQGIDVVFGNWRGAIGPKGLKEPQIAFWDGALSAVSKNAEWNAELEQKFWVNTYRNSHTAKQYWQAQYEQLDLVLTGLSLAKK